MSQNQFPFKNLNEKSNFEIQRQQTLNLKENIKSETEWL